MLLQELFNQNPPEIRADLTDISDEHRDEVAGMLRGLLCAVEGFDPIEGLTNELMKERPVKLKFSSVEKARHFKSRVDLYFSDQILDQLKLSEPKLRP